MIKKQLVRQFGFTLLEVLISLGIMSSVMVGLANLSDQFAKETVISINANQSQTFANASRAYIKDNYSAIMAIATPTVAAKIDTATLIAAGKLPAGFVGTNAYGHTYCTLVLEPIANRLQGLVVAEGGQTVDDISLASLAGIIGGSGGGVYSTDTTVVRGAVGGWSIPVATYDNRANNVGTTCTGSAGNVRLAVGRPVVALWFENGDTSSAFLARDAVPGRPELNQMNTPIMMNSIQTEGASCTTGSLARNSTGAILSCENSVYRVQGNGSCKADDRDLNLIQEDGRCYNSAGNPNSPAGGDWFFLEVSRHMNVTNFYTSQRVTGMTGGSVGKVWQRNQQSATSGQGWSGWVQMADPGVSIANGSVYAGRGQFSRDGAGPCCGDTGTISLAENTASTGRTASISLHNGGIHEGNIELAGSGARRIRLYDNQGAGMGLDATGSISAGGSVNAGTNLSVGPNSYIQGQGAQGPYGATTISGQKNGYTGLEFRDYWGNYQVTQLTNRGNVGYYDTATSRWLNYSDSYGNLTLNQNDYDSGRLNPGWAIETYSCTTGQIAKAAYTLADGWAWNGKTLTCVSGVWRSSAPQYQFGGQYTLGLGGYGCDHRNPITGGYSCPAGFNDSVVHNSFYAWGACPNVQYYLHSCWK